MPPILPQDVDAKTFLLTIPYAHGVGGFASLSRIKPDPADPNGAKNITQHDPYDLSIGIDAIISGAKRFSGQWHVYYGVCPMRQKWPHKTGTLLKDGTDEIARRGTNKNAAACCFLWLDADYKSISPDHAVALAEYVKRLKSFPLRPTAAVMSGGGIQVMWGLREPAIDEELKRISPINEKISKALGGDHVQDLARILRFPGTANIKKRCARCGDLRNQNATSCHGGLKPPIEGRGDCGGPLMPPIASKIIVWRPEARYNLSDFDFLNPEIPSAPSVAVPAGVPAAGGTATADLAAGAVDISSVGLSNDAKEIIIGGLPAYIAMLKRRLSEADFEKRKKENKLSRSEQDAWVVSQLLAASLGDEQMYTIYRDPKNRCGEKYRERKDGDRYLGTTIKNCREFKEKHPKTSPETIAAKVGQGLEKKFGDAQIEILKITVVEYDDDPVYEVTTRIVETNDEFTTSCDKSEFFHYKFFRERYVSKNHQFPPAMNQEKWEEQCNHLKPWEVRKVEKQISGPRGEIEEALTEWLGNRKLKDKNSESAIKHLPLYDEKFSRVLFRTEALMKYLKDSAIGHGRAKVIDVLQGLGYKPLASRFGRAVLKVWAKEMGNGNGHPEDPEETPPPPPPEPAPSLPQKEIQTGTTEETPF